MGRAARWGPALRCNSTIRQHPFISAERCLRHISIGALGLITTSCVCCFPPSLPHRLVSTTTSLEGGEVTPRDTQASK